jgi:hypothetical protein
LVKLLIETGKVSRLGIELGYRLLERKYLPSVGRGQ